MTSPMSPLPSDAFVPEPDLHPLYPSLSYLEPLLVTTSGLSPAQKHDLVQHSLLRACTFADHALLSYLLSDPNPRAYVDLAVQDEDGLGLISTTILGFGGESDRDLDREECVRLLVGEGADVNATDNAGWSALHHAGLLSPPTLVSYLLNHGSSPLALTRRGLTPLDILTAHSLIPGREAVAFLIEEAMREHGWSGGRMEQRRRREDERVRRQDKRMALMQDVGRVLGLHDHWWGEDPDEENEEDEDTDEEEAEEDGPMDMAYSPPANFTTMLVFSPTSLANILDSLTYSIRPSLRCSEPARALYLLTRFACLTCDDTWLEDLMGGAVDRIERIVFAQADDVALQAFWLFNTTALLHFLRCDTHVAEICDLLDLFSLLEGVIRAIFVFIIRIAERKMDPLLDAALLDHSPLSSEFDSLHFEGEWSFLRSFASSGAKLTKRKHDSTPPVSHVASSSASVNGVPTSPHPTSRPPSPSPSLQNFQSGTSPNPRFSWTHSLTRARASTLLPNSSSLSHPDGQPTSGQSPREITTQLEALHTLLTLAGVNPALITQIYSQVMYWTACELFNRILTRKKYLCRSRAIQIGMNLSVLEEWVVNSGLPHGVESHFSPVRELLHWLQCSSSVTEFTMLIETIQTMKHLNPLQMRRAVRDYRYEVSESRMSEECAQYLVQLQKDWERRRVRLGVEALRREMSERDHDLDGSVSSIINDASESTSHAPSISTISTDKSDAQRGIDLLFSRDHERADWIAPQPPEALGELRDSRYMLPLVLPSDPRLLAAVPCSSASSGARRSKRDSAVQTPVGNGGAFSRLQEGRSASRASAAGRGAMAWRSRGRKLRVIGIETLEWVDGVRGLGRWSTGTDVRSLGGDVGGEEEEGEEEEESGDALGEGWPMGNGEAKWKSGLSTALTQKPRKKSSSRRDQEVESIGDDTTMPAAEA